MPAAARRLLTLLPIVFLCLSARAVPQPLPRVASLNLASDQLLISLADREQIAAVTWFAADPELSPLAEQARGLHAIRGEAEEVLLLRPDIVFIGRHSAPHTTGFLRRAGLRLVEVNDPPNTFEQMEENIVRVGGACGHPERAAAAVARLREALAQVRRSTAGERLRVLPYELNTWSPGKGVLLHALILEAGHTPVTDEMGISGYAQIPLERVLFAKPDVVLAPRTAGRAPALANLLFEHPVWKAAGAPRLVRLPQSAGQVAGLDAVAQVRELARIAVQIPQEEPR